MTALLTRTKDPGIFKAGPSYIVRYRDHAGKQRQKTCTTLTEAKRFRAKVTLNPAAGSPRSGPSVTEYATEWLAMLAGVRPATASEYRRDLENYVEAMRKNGLTNTFGLVRAMVVAVLKHGGCEPAEMVASLRKAR